LIGTAALALIGVCVGLMAQFRIAESKKYSEPHELTTYGGTNYIAQLLEATVGRTDSNMVVIVYLRLQNPNPFSLTLKRDWFVLVDNDKDYYQPSTSGTQTPLIVLPPHAVLDREMLTFAVLDGSLGGSIGLQLGQNHWVLVKGPNPYEHSWKVGEFRSFRRRDW
jgi:hypothetical protein